MVFTFLVWIYAAVICFAYGWWWVEIIARAGYGQRKTQIPVEIILVAGSGVLSVLLGILHIWLPISIVVQVFIVAGALGTFWFFKKNIFYYFRNLESVPRYKWFYYCFLVIFGLLILIQATQPALNPDTGLYHAQTIKWFNTYRIVPGLGNLYVPLALNSHAHVVISFFNFSFVTPQVLNQTWVSFVFLVYSSFAIRQGLYCLKTRPAFVIYYFGSLFGGLVFFRDWISSPTPDTVVMFFFFFLFGVLLLNDKNRKIDWEFAFLFFLLPVLLTFKLSAIYGCLIGLAWWLAMPERTNNSRIFKFIFWQTFVVLGPYSLRNVILTGHLLYPLPAFDLFNLDWEVPKVWLQIYQEGITAYSRVPTSNWSIYQNKPLPVWLSVWWPHQDRPVQLFLFILVSFLPLMVWQVIKLSRQRSEMPLITWWLSAFIASLAWFFTAPAVRFGYGYLVPTLLLGLVLLVQNRISFTLAFSIVWLMGLYGVNGIYKQLNRHNYSFIWPAQYPVPETEIRQIGNVKVKVALGFGRCYDLLPCTVPDPHPGLEMRGKKLQDGFRTATSQVGE